MLSLANSDARLTSRQREVVEGLLAGRSIKEIAVQLGISYYGVKDHLKRIYARERVSSARALILKLALAPPAAPAPAEPDWPPVNRVCAMLGLARQLRSLPLQPLEGAIADRLYLTGRDLLRQLEARDRRLAEQRLEAARDARSLVSLSPLASTRAARRWLRQSESLLACAPPAQTSDAPKLAATNPAKRAAVADGGGRLCARASISR